MVIAEMLSKVIFPSEAAASLPSASRDVAFVDFGPAFSMDCGIMALHVGLAFEGGGASGLRAGMLSDDLG
jgi:hypothetical protein